jgi:hypothetical protein
MIVARHWWLMSVILAAWEAEIRNIKVRSQPWQIPSIEKVRWSGLKMVEGLPSKHEAMSSNPNTTKKKKKCNTGSK